MTTGQILLVGGVGVIGLIGVYMIIDSNNRAVISSANAGVNNNGTSNVPVWQQITVGAVQGLTTAISNWGSSSSSSRSGTPGSKGEASGVSRANYTLNTRESGPAVAPAGSTPVSGHVSRSILDAFS